MYSDSELTETISALESADPAERAAMLKALWAWPAEDKRLWPYLEALLADSAPCTFGTPLKISEMCWLAAHTLAAEFKILKVTRPVELTEVVRPLPFADLQRIAEEAGIDVEPDREQLFRTFTLLRDAGRLPMQSLTL